MSNHLPLAPLVAALPLLPSPRCVLSVDTGKQDLIRWSVDQVCERQAKVETCLGMLH